MSTHTPGPWTFNEQKGTIANGDIVVAFLGGASSLDMAPIRANAHLIAAAPRLLKALEAMRYAFDNHDLLALNDAASLADTAIAAAKGEA